MLLLEARKINYQIKDRVLLDIDMLQIHRGDRIGLVGKNGSGKTTLLNILSRKINLGEGVVIQYRQTELLPQLKPEEGTKSGGEITQKYINEMLHKYPEVLLADEPTANLDVEHIEWLEKILQFWRGAFVVVSHDRAFLDNVCQTIWEIDKGEIKIYKGNYSAYSRQKEIEHKEQQTNYERYEMQKQQLEIAIQSREEKAAKATRLPKHVSPSDARLLGAKTKYAKKEMMLNRTAKAMETRLEKLEIVTKTKEIAKIQMDIPNQETFKHKIIMRIDGLAGKIGQRVLWEKANFYVRGGDKLAIIGPNGSGKTTLIKMIVNQAEGISLSPAVRLGYFSQNLNILEEEKTILENVSVTSKQTETLMRIILARLHFFTDDVHKKVGILSGGERVKVALAKLLLSDINTLVLDEPTNYLDIEAMGALESLLKDYEGTVIFVTHDRHFIGEIATRILEIGQQKLYLFEGGYDAYLQDIQAKSSSRLQDEILVIETKISDVLSRLSIEPSEALEEEFQQLLVDKKELKRQDL